MKTYCFPSNYSISCFPANENISLFVNEEIYDEFYKLIEDIFIISKMLEYKIKMFEEHTCFYFLFSKNSNSFYLQFFFDNNRFLTNVFIEKQNPNTNIIDSLKDFISQLWKENKND